jgi:hypothetical protein
VWDSNDNEKGRRKAGAKQQILSMGPEAEIRQGRVWTDRDGQKSESGPVGDRQMPDRLGTINDARKV